jgi:hypothetical protein
MNFKIPLLMSATYAGLFAAALISLTLTITSVFFLGRKGPWGSIWTFFLVLFLTLGTISIYIAPIGPIYWGVAWMPITIAGILITILLIAAMPHSDYGNSRADRNKATKDSIFKPDYNVSAVGYFFWVLIILFIIAIIVGMAHPQQVL